MTNFSIWNALFNKSKGTNQSTGGKGINKWRNRAKIRGVNAV